MARRSWWRLTTSSALRATSITSCTCARAGRSRRRSTRLAMPPGRLCDDFPERSDRALRPFSVHAQQPDGGGAGRDAVRHHRRVRGAAPHGVHGRCAGAHCAAGHRLRLLQRAEPVPRSGGGRPADRFGHRLALAPRDSARGYRHRDHVHLHVRAGHPADEHGALLPRFHAHPLRQRAGRHAWRSESDRRRGDHRAGGR